MKERTDSWSFYANHISIEGGAKFCQMEIKKIFLMGSTDNLPAAGEPQVAFLAFTVRVANLIFQSD